MLLRLPTLVILRRFLFLNSHTKLFKIKILHGPTVYKNVIKRKKEGNSDKSLMINFCTFLLPIYV